MPRPTAASRTIRTTIRTLLMSWGKCFPRSQSPIVVGDTPAALAKARSEGLSDNGPILKARSASAKTKNSPVGPDSPLSLMTRPLCVRPVQSCGWIESGTF